MLANSRHSVEQAELLPLDDPRRTTPGLVPTPHIGLRHPRSVHDLLPRRCGGHGRVP